MIRAVTADGALRVIACVTTATAREGSRRHGCVGAASVALGRGLTAGLMLATLTKGGEKVQLQILGDGPLGGVTVSATDAGDARGYVHKATVFAAAGGEQRVRLADALGRAGAVNVLRDLGMKEQYTGQCPLVTGEIDEDVEAYLRVSEQITSAMGCEVVLSDAFEIRVSAGVLVQTLPGRDAEARVRDVQHRLRTGGLFEALRGEATAEDVARELLGMPGAELDVLDLRPVRFKCTCSQERVTAMLGLLGPEELAEMISEGKDAEVFCNFCNERYVASQERLRRIRDELTRSHGQA